MEAARSIATVSQAPFARIHRDLPVPLREEIAGRLVERLRSLPAVVFAYLFGSFPEGRPCADTADLRRRSLRDLLSGHPQASGSEPTAPTGS
jgi:hypothetical protein